VIKDVFRKLNGMDRWRKWIFAAFVLTLAFTGFQVFRTVQFGVYWRQHRDEPIAGWMRVGYVANSHQVPRPILDQALGLPPDARDRRPLAEIARAQDRPFEEIKADLEEAINDFRRTQPLRPGGGP
jgi:hypothetical protein